MSTLCAMPTEKNIHTLLAPLFGDDVKVSPGESINIDDGYVANYIDDNDVPIAVCVADLPMVVYGGSIMMMIPKAGADDAIAEKDPSKVMHECFYEVANILSRAVMDDNSEHLRLEKVYEPGTNTELVTGLGADVHTVTVQVEVPSYGVGNATFILK